MVALALPIGKAEDNLYMSYNFEANYVLPSQASQFTKDFYDKIFFLSGVNRNITAARLSSSLNTFSRTNFYKIVEDKIQNLGFNGSACLLRLICEVSKGDLISANGVFGMIMHILFT